ncbi:unnamed protein product, partial [Mesorhabditis belari]|uniref:AB hydrolase-1 domain-containing protein n=1 Tax=Mesorhabditis belari TaxID=2138241 RepID=A0AAF3J6H4_9BILA
MTHSEYSEHFAEIDGQKIGYSKYGHGATNMLTICGGVGCYAKDWPLSTLEHFDPEKYTIISIDPPGYGKSRPPERVQNVFRCQKDAVICMKLMEQLELLPFTAVGWSEGSRTALHLAANGIQKINRCVAMAATTRIEKRAVEVTKGMKNTDLWLPADREPYLKHCSNEFFKKQWADIMDTAEECYNMLGGRFPCDALLPRITCPVLLLNGGQDWFHGDQKEIMSRIKDVKMETQLHGGHDFHLKYPKWVVDKIERFITETS